MVSYRVTNYPAQDFLKHGFAVHPNQGPGGAPPGPGRLVSATVTNSCPIDLKIEPLTYPEHIYTNPMSFFGFLYTLRCLKTPSAKAIVTHQYEWV